VPKRGMFDGLKLNTGKPSPDMAGMESIRPQKPERAPRDIGSKNLEQAAERYARAWTDQRRMRDQSLPTLDYQKRELAEAGKALDTVRPNATQDLQNALRHEPQTWRAMKQLRGPERGAELAGAIRHEDRVRRDPSLQAERLVKEWQGVEKRHDKFRDNYLDKGERAKLECRMKAIAGTIKRDPQLESLVRAKAKEMGVDMHSRLGRVIQAPGITQAMNEIMRGRDRGLSL
jgi:hypothetical protein